MFNRILCFLKGHQHTLYVQLHTLEVNAECTRCGHRLSNADAIRILMRGSSRWYTVG